MDYTNSQYLYTSEAAFRYDQKHIKVKYQNIFKTHSNVKDFVMLIPFVIVGNFQQLDIK